MSDSQNRNIKNVFPQRGHARWKGKTGGVSKWTWINSDIPLVGCLANDTENLFTAGIENSSEEIREVTGVTGTAGSCVCPSAWLFAGIS